MVDTVTRTKLFTGPLWENWKKQTLADTSGLQRETFVDNLTISEIYENAPGS